MGGVSDAQVIGMALAWLATNWVVVSLLCGAFVFMGYLKVKRGVPLWQSTNFLIVWILFFGVLYQSFVDGNGVIVSVFYAVVGAVVARLALGFFDGVFIPK